MAEANETVKKYPEATTQALEYYRTKASEEEKKILFDTIRKAAKSLKKDDGGEKKDKKKKFKGFTPPAPEAVAAALYGVLSQGGGTVDGHPRQGNPTRIDGRFDLNEVARKLMAALS